MTLYILKGGPYDGMMVQRQEAEVYRFPVMGTRPDEDGKIDTAEYTPLPETSKRGRFTIGAMQFRGITKTAQTLAQTLGSTNG